MFKMLTKVLAGATLATGTATVVSGIHDYRISKIGEIEEIGEVEDTTTGVIADAADEALNEV